MENKTIILKDGTKIHTEYSITNKERTIVIVHGGPGNGIWDQIPFMEELSKTYNVVGFDQRGVNKSDNIPESFTSEQLIDDIEEIRHILHLGAICPIGHSYGGHLVLRYCLKYPSSVEKAIFLCPSFDFKDSLKLVIERLSFLCKESDSETFNRLQNLIKSDNSADILEGLSLISEDIQNKVYGYDKVSIPVMNQVMKNAPNPEEMEKSFLQQQAIFNEGLLYEDHTEYLKDLKPKSLLVVGSQDPVCTPRQIEKFKTNVKHGQTIIITDSGHFPYLDSTQETVNIIKSFI